jgi:hypothetical protein
MAEYLAGQGSGRRLEAVRAAARQNQAMAVIEHPENA